MASSSPRYSIDGKHPNTSVIGGNMANKGKDFGNLQDKLAELRHNQETLEKAWKQRSGNKALLEFLVQIMPRALDAERCSIFILDPLNNNVWVQAGTGLAEKQVEVPKSGSMVGQVVTTGQCMIEHDMQNLVGTHDLVAVKTGFVTRNAICVPVHGVTRKQITGAIQVLNKQEGLRFGEDDKKILEELAFLLQMTIENIFIRQELVRMMMEMKRQIELLESKLSTTTG